MAVCPECLVSYADEVEACPEHGCQLVPDDLFLPEESALKAGTMVGEYRIEKKLGAGTFGEVYAGEQPLIGKRVAVKVLNRRFASDPVMISRFIAEARAVNKIRQRNIIDIFSFGVLPELERHYFVMELLEGHTLGELMDELGRVPVSMAIPIVRGIADALDAAHKAGITHRDLKPDNVFVVTESDGTFFPKLLDFGIAKLIGADVAHKTGSGMVLGTPRYMSPEQARGKPADHRADIYALGVMIHEMLTGVAPFVGESSVDLLLKHAVDPPPSMSSACPDLPRALDVPVLAMLEKRPADRPQSAGEAVAAFVACAQKLGLDRAGASSDRTPSGQPANVVRKDDAVWSDPTLVDRPRGAGAREETSTRREGPAPTPLPTVRRPPKAPGGAAARSRREASSTLLSEKGDEGARADRDATEATSTLETESAITRQSRRWKLGVAVGAVVAVGFSIWALGRTPEPARVTTASPPDAGDPARPVTSSALTASTVAPAPSVVADGEPTVRPSVAAADVIELRLSARPADAEVWLGDQKLGSAAGPVMVARGSERVELRLKKAGFKDEPLTLTPDRNQTLEAALSPLAGRPAAIAKPAASVHRMDRILGDRD